MWIWCLFFFSRLHDWFQQYVAWSDYLFYYDYHLYSIIICCLMLVLAKFHPQLTFHELSAKKKNTAQKLHTTLSGDFVFLFWAPQMLFVDGIFQEPKTFRYVWCCKILELLDFVSYWIFIFILFTGVWVHSAVEKPLSLVIMLTTCAKILSQTHGDWNLLPISQK